MLWSTLHESLRLLTSCMSPVEASQHNTALAQVLDEEEHPLVQGGGQNGHAENGLQQHAASLEQTAYGASCSLHYIDPTTSLVYGLSSFMVCCRLQQ